MATALTSCKCSHEFQDRRYGEHNRVHNTTQKKAAPGSVVVRCTVCKSEKEISSTKVR